MFKKLRTVIYHVSDLAAAKDWYAKVTGVTPYFDEPFYVGFDINGFELGLDPDPEHTSAGNQTVSFWAVDNINDVFEKILSLGAKNIQSPTNVGGTIYVATVEDPFGNHIGLIEGA
ncbi:MAG TPA: VOC family protein [Chitinophagaceae bacterium]|jgi:predicted enzyme related to lactoylglutathione lyase|nr:VOC family protein [Chitinophagaceae bacterium]